MKRVRGLGHVTGMLARVVVLAPIVALIPTSFLDRGPGGLCRLSFFPLAVAALDPHIWECFRNSILMALAVTLASRFLGVGIADIVTRRRFWGRPVLAVLVCAGLASPPAFLAIGLRSLIGSDAARLGESFRPFAGWVAWFWVAVSCSVPLVVLAAASGLRRFDPSAEDAARLEGASRGRVWRQFLWPTARPGVAHALATIFTLTLIEPGAPLVLGLRRTLGFQIVEAATDLGIGQLNRASVLALGATLIAVLARILLRWWGGIETRGVPEHLEHRNARDDRTSLGVGSLLAFVLSIVVICVSLPFAGLGFAAMTTIAEQGSVRRGVSFESFVEMIRAPLLRRYLVNSLALGIAAAVLGLILARTLSAVLSGRVGNVDSGLMRLTRLLERMPPLAIGVGVLGLAAVLRFAVDSSGAMTGQSGWTLPLHGFVDILDADKTPGPGLVLAVSLIALPMIARSARLGRASMKPSRFEAAILLGASPRLARRGLRTSWLGVAPIIVFASFVTAFSNITPALVFATTSASRTAGPAVLTLVEEPGIGGQCAAAFAILVISLNVVALAIAARGDSEGFRSWPRV